MSGHIFVISGPSGVGKGTLCALLLKARPDLVLSVSATSRPMRAGEREGVNYHFKTLAEFEAMVEHDAEEPDPAAHILLEWAEYNGHYYGTPRAAVETALAQGNNVLLEIDVRGALTVKRKFSAARLIFIAPPGMDELERRLRGRNSDPEAVIHARLAIAGQEMPLRDRFDHVVVNDDLNICLTALLKAISSPPGR